MLFSEVKPAVEGNPPKSSVVEPLYLEENNLTSRGGAPTFHVLETTV